MELDIKQIMERLPHRYPMLLVDRVLEMVPGKSIVAIKNVTLNEPFFQGHFPHNPVMPGVLIVEAMAQTAAVLVGLSRNLMDTETLVYFLGLDSCRFRRMVVPGDELRMELTVKRPGGKVWRLEGRALVDGELACEATLTAMLDTPARTDG